MGDTVVEKIRCLMFVYRDSRQSNYINTAKVTLSPSETIEDIFSFASRLETMVYDPFDEEGGGNDYDSSFHDEVWNVIRAAKENSLSDGGSGFANFRKFTGNETSVKFVGWGVVLSAF